MGRWNMWFVRPPVLSNATSRTIACYIQIGCVVYGSQKVGSLAPCVLYSSLTALILLGTAQSATSTVWAGNASKAKISISVNVRAQVVVYPVLASPKAVELRSGAIAHSFCVQANSGTNRYLIRAEFSGHDSASYKVRWIRPNQEETVSMDSDIPRDFPAQALALRCGRGAESTFGLIRQKSSGPSSPPKGNLTLIIAPM